MNRTGLTETYQHYGHDSQQHQDQLSSILIDQFDLTLFGGGYTNTGNLVGNEISHFFSTFNPDFDQSSGSSSSGISPEDVNTGSLWTPEDLNSENGFVDSEHFGNADQGESGLNTAPNFEPTQVLQRPEDPHNENSSQHNATETVDEYLMHQTLPTPVQRCRKKQKVHKMKVAETLIELDSEIFQSKTEFEVLSSQNSILNDIWDIQNEIVPSIGLTENEKNLTTILQEKAALLASKPPLKNKEKHYAWKRKRLLQLEEDEVTVKKFRREWFVQETARMRSIVQRKRVQTKQIIQNRMLSG